MKKEKKLVEVVMIDDEPAPAAQQETKAKAPKVSYKLNKGLAAFPLSCLHDVPLKSNIHSLL